MFTDTYDKIKLTHTPTALEHLNNLSLSLDGPNIWIKRDDCTGLAMGGNKARQLEYYFGHAQMQSSDTILTTGAIQSNHVRMTVAAARKQGLDVEVLLEQRVPDRSHQYYQSGNPFLVQLMGAKIHFYDTKEDEDGADNQLFAIGENLRNQGRTPYVIPLSEGYTPYGCLGYVDCAVELLQQCKKSHIKPDAIILATGSATTHAGLLVGIRALGFDTPVMGFCVRRDKALQAKRALKKAQHVAQMIGFKGIISEADIWVDDTTLSPGYGQLNEPSLEALDLLAQMEGILLDPIYTAKAMAGLINLVRQKQFKKQQNIIFLHTGGSPALFGYPEILENNFLNL